MYKMNIYMYVYMYVCIMHVCNVYMYVCVMMYACV